jgi:hypothetical protein
MEKLISYLVGVLLVASRQAREITVHYEDIPEQYEVSMPLSSPCEAPHIPASVGKTLTILWRIQK